MRKLLTRILYRTAQRIAPSYIAGPEVKDAIRLCRQVDQQGWCSTICPWDGPSESPEIVASSYKEALSALKSETLDCNLSVKVPSLKYDFNTLKELLDMATEQKRLVHFDALGPETASSSLSLLERAAKTYKNLGYTLPARWRRSLSDAKELIDMRVGIRVVKGQWPDPVEPNLDPKACFLDLIEVLSGKAAKVGVATHDVALAKMSLMRLQGAGTPCELEQLFGLPLCADSVAKPLNIKARLYVPYGYPYLPYAISDARKRPVVFAWLLKDLLLGKKKYLKA